jgi:hypothetical protein
VTRTELFRVTCGRRTTADQASDGLFPGCQVVYVGCEDFGDTVTYHYLVEYQLTTKPPFGGS